MNLETTPLVEPAANPSLAPRRASADEMLESLEILFANGDFSLAEGLTDVALSENPEHPRLNELGAVVFLECKKNAKALECALRFLESGRDRVRGHLLLGEVFLEMNQVREARVAFEYYLGHAAAGDPDMFQALKSMGNIHVRERDLDAAEELYARAMVLNPQSDALLVNFGVLEIQRQRWNEARERFRAALASHPANDRAWLGLALVHRAFSDHDLAWANVCQALDLNPNNETAAGLLTEWAAADGRLSEAASRIDALRARCSPALREVYASALATLFARVGVQVDGTGERG
jgi:Tfp pilus assembly protein PilF